ncbi:MAG: endolytic transglycosylase MltG [bacterium]|nr:endolytic transglycosylase MltG [bacterium]
MAPAPVCETVMISEWLPRASKRWKLLGMIFILAAAAIGGGYAFLQRDFATPFSHKDTQIVLVRVPLGAGINQVARDLSQKNLIRSAWLFALQARLRGGATRIHQGFYEFRPSMRPWAIYRSLIEGRVAYRTFTIPEGFTLPDIAAAIEKAQLGERGAILLLARDAEFLSTLKIPKKSMEGYLFPATYRFPLGTSPRHILRIMTGTLREKIRPAMRARAAQMGFTLHQVLTLASIIEKETSVPSERPLIAAVFLNRLKRNMPLQSDPTVIYALPNFDGNLRRKDLSYDSPYNTYRRRGLPPGPIASPGLESIRAVLFPAKVDYLYFVATNEGGHKFSRTYKEHQQSVVRYQLRKKRKVDR